MSEKENFKAKLENFSDDQIKQLEQIMRVVYLKICDKKIIFGLTDSSLFANTEDDFDRNGILYKDFPKTIDRNDINYLFHVLAKDFLILHNLKNNATHISFYFVGNGEGFYILKELVDKKYYQILIGEKKEEIRNKKNPIPTEIIEDGAKKKKPGYQILIEKDIGYLKLKNQGPKIRIGKQNSRHFKLFHFLASPFNSAKTIDSVFDAIKLSKDKNDQMLNGYNLNQSTNRKIDLIKYAIKEFQKIKEFQGKFKFELDREQKTYRLRII